MSSAYEEGKKAYHKKRNQPGTGNPYQLGSSEYNEFERGWVQALKRSGNSPFTNPLLKYSSEEQQPKERRQPDKSVIERYLAKKGKG